MKQTPLENKISEIIGPAIERLGLSLVCVKITGEGGGKNVQIMAEDPATKNLDIEKCAELSRSASALIDVEDPIDGHYRLEVSSPGIDRPLMNANDFIAYKGFEAKIETNAANEQGQRRFKGILNGIKNDIVMIETEQGHAEIPLDMITKAKLVLNEKLLKTTQKVT
jgi:ribosome maturation factor RimP